MFLFLLAGCVCLSISLHLKHHLYRAMVFHMSSINVQVDCDTSLGHDCLHMGHCHADVDPRFSRNRSEAAISGANHPSYQLRGQLGVPLSGRYLSKGLVTKYGEGGYKMGGGA